MPFQLGQSGSSLGSATVESLPRSPLARRGRWSPRREVHLALYFFPAMTCAATGRLTPPRRHRLRLQRGARHARWPNRYQRGSCAVVRPSYGGSYGR
jgi:hypothetical protein